MSGCRANLRNVFDASCCQKKPATAFGILTQTQGHVQVGQKHPMNTHEPDYVYICLIKGDKDTNVDPPNKPLAQEAGHHSHSNSCDGLRELSASPARAECHKRSSA